MIGGGVGQCRGYPANMPAHDDDDDDDDDDDEARRAPSS